MLCGFVGNQLQKLVKVLLRVQAGRDIQQRAVSFNNGMRRFDFGSHMFGEDSIPSIPKRNHNVDDLPEHNGIYEILKLGRR
jgi:hypothetical protein